jgi:hypothetical protein
MNLRSKDLTEFVKTIWGGVPLDEILALSSPHKPLRIANVSKAEVVI